ncbi:MAG: divalent-cation tolerance protein CutA [Opitutaceae bacterium]
MNDDLYLGWTTCDNQDVADRLARDIVERQLAACVKVESVQSHYRFDGELHHESELRLCIKFTGSKTQALEAYIQANHPYETPEWIVIKPERVSEKYLLWAQGSV